MFHIEMKTLLSVPSTTKLHLICFILIIITGGECLPRHIAAEKTQENPKRKWPLINSVLGDNNFEEIPRLYSKNEIYHKPADYHDGRIRKHSHERYASGIQNTHSEPKSEHNAHPSAFYQLEMHSGLKNKDTVETDSLNRRKESSPLHTKDESFDSLSHIKNLHDEEDADDDDTDDEDSTDEPRIDLILNDLNMQKATGSETVMDYYYVSDAGEYSHYGVPKHGVIINLRGLIPSRLKEEEEVLQERLPQSRGNDEKSDEVLAFKAYQISSSPLSVDPGRSVSEFDDQLTEEAIDVRGHQRTNATLHENRNLSRKRRQKATPSQEETSDRHRKGHFRKRRRKRKRRLRLKNGDVREGRRSEDRLLLKSNSPAYVITSAKEVKRDWCKTISFKQTIVESNCKPRVITNNLCYGQCNSFFIPHSGKADSGSAFESCAFCKPHNFRWTTVTLNCPGQIPRKVEKKVLMVDSCICRTEKLQSIY